MVSHDTKKRVQESRRAHKTHIINKIPWWKWALKKSLSFSEASSLGSPWETCKLFAQTFEHFLKKPYLHFWLFELQNIHWIRVVVNLIIFWTIPVEKLLNLKANFVRLFTNKLNRIPIKFESVFEESFATNVCGKGMQRRRQIFRETMAWVHKKERTKTQFKAFSWTHFFVVCNLRRIASFCSWSI